MSDEVNAQKQLGQVNQELKPTSLHEQRILEVEALNIDGTEVAERIEIVINRINRYLNALSAEYPNGYPSANLKIDVVSYGFMLRPETFLIQDNESLKDILWKVAACPFITNTMMIETIKDILGYESISVLIGNPKAESYKNSLNAHSNKFRKALLNNNTDLILARVNIANGFGHREYTPEFINYLSQLINENPRETYARLIPAISEVFPQYIDITPNRIRKLVSKHNIAINVFEKPYFWTDEKLNDLRSLFIQHRSYEKVLEILRSNWGRDMTLESLRSLVSVNGIETGVSSVNADLVIKKINSIYHGSPTSLKSITEELGIKQNTASQIIDRSVQNGDIPWQNTIGIVKPSSLRINTSDLPYEYRIGFEGTPVISYADMLRNVSENFTLSRKEVRKRLKAIHVNFGRYSLRAIDSHMYRYQQQISEREQ